MKYSLQFIRRAQKELCKVPDKDIDSISAGIKKLADNPCPEGANKLVGRSGWRIRAGDYRVIYEINHHERTITILHVGKRKDIYR